MQKKYFKYTSCMHPGLYPCFVSTLTFNDNTNPLYFLFPFHWNCSKRYDKIIRFRCLLAQLFRSHFIVTPVTRYKTMLKPVVTRNLDPQRRRYLYL